MTKKILLADDSITIQKVVELTFSDGDYEVTAVNNGAKAIQKLSEMRPDIILSDIIMPERNGYEVCEYVKSHPEYRHIPVILLTGTFEPFDPDRAEKAGCDAVVTKPFESQSLIHKVEELIQHAGFPAASAPAASAPVEPLASAFESSNPFEAAPSAPTWSAPAPSQFATTAFAAEPEPEPVADSPFDSTGGASLAGKSAAFQHDNDIFSAAPAPAPSHDMPFESEPEPAAEPAAFGGETRAFPRMSFEELQKMAPAAAEPSPWDSPAAPAEPSWSAPVAEPDPWAAPAPVAAPEPAAFGGETRAFPRMSLEELQQVAAPEPVEEPSPWDTPAAEPEPSWNAPAAESQPSWSTPAAEPAWAAPAEEPSPWDAPAAAVEPEVPAFSGETRAFPQMSLEELQRMAGIEPAGSAPEPEEAPSWDTPAPPAAEPEWAAPEEMSAPVADSFAAPDASPFAESAAEHDDSPFAAPASSLMAPAESSAFGVDSNWGAPAAPPAAYEAQSSAPEQEPEAQGEPLVESAPAPAAASGSFELTDAQVDRIARRVVELMSEQVVRNVAWEVIPDLAEIVVKERIRQLEGDA